MVEEHFAGCSLQDSLQNLLELVDKAEPASALPALGVAALDHVSVTGVLCSSIHSHIPLSCFASVHAAWQARG